MTVALPDKVRQYRPEELAALSPRTLAAYHSRGRLKASAHLRLVDKWLVMLAETDLDVLMVMEPPGHAKSVQGSQYFPAWWLGIRPDDSVLLTSYGSDFAAGWSGRARDVLKEVGKPVFGVTVDPKRSSEAEWWLKGHEGRMYARGLDSGVTGLRAHLLVMDDIYKTAAEAHSEAYRQQVIDFMQEVAFGRMHVGGKMLFINYRWNLRDLHAWMLERAEMAGLKVKVLRLPALAEEGDELGRAVGEPLWPERFPKAWLEQRRVLVGEAAFAAQYQQDPAPPSGALFMQNWWGYWGPEAVACEEKWLSVDCALKDTNSSDFVVVQCWGMKGDCYYLLDQDRRRMDYIATKDAIRAMYGKYGPRYTLIEDKANGPAVIRALRREIPGIVPMPAKDSKVGRAGPASDLAKSGRVFLPRPLDKPWVDGFISEAIAFPNGPHDDQVDALSQALARFAGSARAQVEVMEEEPERGRKRKWNLFGKKEKVRAGHFGPGFDDAAEVAA